MIINSDSGIQIWAGKYTIRTWLVRVEISSSTDILADTDMTPL